jgi:hypothetical protein
MSRQKFRHRSFGIAGVAFTPPSACANEAVKMRQGQPIRNLHAPAREGKDLL